MTTDLIYRKAIRFLAIGSAEPVKGGAYFFLPGIRALRFLADGVQATCESPAYLSEGA